MHSGVHGHSRSILAHIVPVSTFPPDNHYRSSQGLQLCRPGELLLTSGSVPKIF